MKSVLCPICNGNGLVPNGFYTQTTGAWSSASAEPETCRSCEGKGYLWAFEGDMVATHQSRRQPVNKFREAIARMLAHFDNRKWEDLPDKTTNLSTMFYSKAHYLHRADQLFEIRKGGCRLAIVKEVGELPSDEWLANLKDLIDPDSWYYFKKWIADDREQTVGERQLKSYFEQAHYVQEETSE